MKLFKRVTMVAVVFFISMAFLAIPMSTRVYATELEDNLSQQHGSQNSQSNDFLGSIKNQDIGEADDIGDILGSQNIMTSEHLSQASIWAAPLTNLIGYVIGGIVTLTIILVGFLTAVDIFYISIPPVRNLLYKAGTDGTGAYQGGYGMGGMSASGGTAKPTQWVSDEAVACAALLGGSSQSMNIGMNMGMGMGGNQPKPPVKSVIWVYIKKRSVFLVLLMVAILVLTSSALMGTGINLAQWLLKIIMMLNGSIA